MRYVDYDHAVKEMGFKGTLTEFYKTLATDAAFRAVHYRRARNASYPHDEDDFKREVEIWDGLWNLPNTEIKPNLEARDDELIQVSLEDHSNTHVSNLGWAGLTMEIALQLLVTTIREQWGEEAYWDLFGWGLVVRGVQGEVLVTTPTTAIYYMDDSEWRLVWRDWTIEWYKHTRRCLLVSRVLSYSECQQFLHEALEAFKPWLDTNHPPELRKPVPTSSERMLAQKHLAAKLARNGVSGAAMHTPGPTDSVAARSAIHHNVGAGETPPRSMKEYMYEIGVHLTSAKPSESKEEK